MRSASFCDDNSLTDEEIQAQENAMWEEYELEQWGYSFVEDTPTVEPDNYDDEWWDD